MRQRVLHTTHKASRRPVAALEFSFSCPFFHSEISEIVGKYQGRGDGGGLPGAEVACTIYTRPLETERVRYESRLKCTTPGISLCLVAILSP